MQTGSIANWLLKEGDSFQAGTAICEVETDKAVVTFDATEEGYIAKILVGKGEIKVFQFLLLSFFLNLPFLSSSCLGWSTNNDHC